MSNLPFNYTGNLTWLPERIIYITKHGSHAYGTAIPTSDLDIRGICIAPKEYYFGFSKSFEQAIQAEPDLTIFELRKFFNLAIDANPNVLELLFTDQSDHLLTTPLGEKLLTNRELFLSKKVKFTFQGYAYSQMKRIVTHRRWLLNPVEKQPSRGDFGLPERTVIPADQLAAAQAAISKKVDEWAWNELENVGPDIRIALQTEFTRRLLEITQWSEDQVVGKVWQAAGTALGFDTNFIQVMDQERRYLASFREFQQYQDWKKNRNPIRAEMEAKFGFDGKHALHLVRLSRCCKELLLTGKLNVRRSDAEELLSIRKGAWTFDQLINWFEKQAVEIEEAYLSSSLPRSPNRFKIDELCISIVEESF
jgi:hypothetical protein